jgi:hypothetical protein
MWTCQAAAVLNAVALAIGAPLAAIVNVRQFKSKGLRFGSADVAWAAFGQPLMTVVVTGGLLTTNLKLLQYAHLIAA